MSISGVVGHFKNTGPIKERYAIEDKKINQRAEIIQDAITELDKVESIPWSKAGIEKRDSVKFWEDIGYTYDKKTDSFHTEGGKFIDYPVLKAAKSNFELGLLDVEDLIKIQEYFAQPIKKYEGGLGLTERLQFTTEGEDEILTTIKGEPALITQAEKNLKDLAGPVGEEIIAATGSGEEVGGIKHYEGGAGINFDFGKAVEDSGGSLEGFLNAGLMAISPTAALLNMGIKEFNQASNTAQMNKDQISHLEQGIDRMTGKIGQVEDDFSNFKNEAIDNVKGKFQELSANAGGAIDKLGNRINTVFKKSGGLSTGTTQIVKDNLINTINETTSIVSNKAFDELNSAIEGAGRKTQDTIEDLGLAIKDSKYKIDTFKKSDEWEENFMGGMFKNPVNFFQGQGWGSKGDG